MCADIFVSKKPLARFFPPLHSFPGFHSSYLLSVIHFISPWHGSPAAGTEQQLDGMRGTSGTPAFITY